MSWINICPLSMILPGTGVCALVGNQQVAIFRPDDSAVLYALDNLDPFSGANVLSRGLIVEHDHLLWVASPLKKQHFCLQDGRCMEDSVRSVRAWPVKVEQDCVWLPVRND
ncbi:MULTISPECIES: nitrite reductase small subunit NirD [unclassified Paludibacterium]|uniref:nitrite reductase small subunit NirD n=1 Tax=unclassified Paludibacterium TaxID=2618429 RepID=UPI001C058C55|nr:nitrite reductase small subunit NirD [Paludibacterium sp. B53371]BEV71345.1 nitrite reductase small subunit NirD [Paludibacterium sp. THUN1379]